MNKIEDLFEFTDQCAITILLVTFKQCLPGVVFDQNFKNLKFKISQNFKIIETLKNNKNV